MIKVLVQGRRKEQSLYLLGICLRIVGYRHEKIRDLASVGERDVLITNVPGVAHAKKIELSDRRLEGAFRRLSLFDETTHRRYDRFGRLSGRDQGAELADPAVNDLAQKLGRAIRELGAGDQCQHTQPRPVVFLSHDVDRTTNRDPFVVGGNLLGLTKAVVGLDLAAAGMYLRSLALALKGDNTYWNFERYKRMESDRGFRSTFFVMLGRRGLHGARYDARKLSSELKALCEEGWEVGLHINHYHHGDLEEVKREKLTLERMIGQEVLGARFHYLTFDPQHSFELLERAGFKYDTTVGFHDAIGYRAGIAYPFKPYDPTTQSSREILEIPLVVMDLALFHAMKLSAEEALARMKGVLDRYRDRDAVIAILWHQCVLRDPVFPGWRETYEQLLDYLRDNAFQVLTGKEIHEKYV